jgi:hypothetical protein
MQEPNDLETAIVVAQAPNPRAREILMPANQSMMVTQVGTLRPEFGNAVPTEGSLRFLQKYSREKMGWFVAGGAARRANPIVIFKMKALTRWLVRPLPDAIVGARDFVDAAESPRRECRRPYQDDVTHQNSLPLGDIRRCSRNVPVLCRFS